MLGRSATLLGMSATLQGRSATLQGRSATLLGMSATLQGRSASLQGRSSFLIAEIVDYLYTPGVELNSPLVQWFWEILETFSPSERSLFLRFVWGRTRLPRNIADFRGRDFVLQVWSFTARITDFALFDSDSILESCCYFYYLCIYVLCSTLSCVFTQ